MDDTQNVELLSFVLVYTLDLNVEERMRVNADTSRLFDMLGQPNLVGKLDLLPFFLERLVVDVVLQLVQEGEVGKEIVASEFRSNEVRKARVGLVQPSSRSNTVRDVGEFVRTVDADKVFEDGCLDEIRVELGNTIDLVATNDG